MRAPRAYFPCTVLALLACHVPPRPRAEPAQETAITSGRAVEDSMSQLFIAYSERRISADTAARLIMDLAPTGLAMNIEMDSALRAVLGWETTVAEVFPDLVGRINAVYLSVTLEELLSHRAGIVAWEEDEEISRAPIVAGSPTQMRRAAVLWLLNQAPVAPPGTTHVYSNAGYIIAAAMAEQVTRMAWENLVLERLADPLELASLGFGWPAQVDPSQPWGHKSSPDGFVAHDPNDDYQAGPLLGPAGDLRMSIVDLARFAQLHLDGLQGKARLLSVETFQKLHHPWATTLWGGTSARQPTIILVVWEPSWRQSGYPSRGMLPLS